MNNIVPQLIQELEEFLVNTKKMKEKFGIRDKDIAYFDGCRDGATLALELINKLEAKP